MAVKTAFSAELLASILSGYDLGEYVGSKGFDRGADQTNMQIATSSGKFAFRYYEKRPEDYVQFEIDILQFLGSHSYPSPAPIQRRDGSYFGIYNGKPTHYLRSCPVGTATITTITGK